MCFSASASFIASTILTTVGVKTISVSKKPNQYYLAATPIIFGLQQFSEGILWLSVSNPSLAHLQGLATYAFVIIGALLWPAWIPFAIMKLEPIKKHKSKIRITWIVGLSFSVAYSIFMFFYPVKAIFQSHHIQYRFYFPNYVEYTYLFYFIAVVIPLFISSIKQLRLVGIISVLTLITTEIVYHQFLFSVWCFFVSTISILIYFVLKKFNADNLSSSKVGSIALADNSTKV